MNKAKRSTKGNGKALCPYCRDTDEVIPILYGMPSSEGFELAERGEVFIGGCIPGKTHYYCKRDNREF